MIGYHFLPEDGKIPHGDGRIVKAGCTYRVPDMERKLVLCKYGMHASKRVMDALKYAPGPIICKVQLSGGVIHGDDKAVGRERRVIAMADATDVLRKFARLCALDVIHLWDAPEIVVLYLKTGDESIRAAAQAAAWAAARDAAGDAAWAAWAAGVDAWAAARAAAWDAAQAAAWAARDAAGDAAWAAARDAAGDAARAAARDAARDKQNRRLTRMVDQLWKKGSVPL